MGLGMGEGTIITFGQDELCGIMLYFWNLGSPSNTFICYRIPWSRTAGIKQSKEAIYEPGWTNL